MSKARPNDDDRHGTGLRRREFLTSLGAGAVGTTLPLPAEPAAAPPSGDTLAVTLRVNDRAIPLVVEPRTTLLQALRDSLRLTGTKPGCERGECGACTVLVDGVPRYSCLTLAAEAGGHDITTIEGLCDGEALGPVQEAFVEEDAFQCGYCTSGQVMAAEGLLRRVPAPSRDEIRSGMSGNLCRCGAYPHIVNAVARAAEVARKGRRK